MALLDIAIVALIFISVLVGLLRGFTKELLSIASWVISIYLAFNFYKYAAEYLAAYINNEWLSNVAGGAIIFVGSLFILSMIGYLISKAVAATGVKGTDRVLGAVLGAVRGVLIIGFMVVVASIFNVQAANWWKKSTLIGHFSPVAETINSVLPEKFKVKKAMNALNAGSQIQSVISPNSESDSTERQPEAESATDNQINK
ncbi:MAG: CvpA family protein [Arenicella sp.]